MPLDARSLERLVPEELRPGDVTGAEALRIGEERYRFAARHARPGRLLDLACGVGYGTRILAEEAPVELTALGVDVDPEAIAHARARYAHPRLRFEVADAMAFEDPEGFDTVVSIETLEHVPDPAALAERLVRLLRPGGVLVASVPVTPSVDANPHHLHDFSERSFRRLFEPHGLDEIAAFRQVQPWSPLAILRRSEPRLEDVRKNLPAWYLRHPDSLARRLWSTFRDGFNNKYLTVAWRCGVAS